MDDFDVLDESANDPTDFGITPTAINFLTEIRKWVNFLAILGFIMVGLMALFSLFAGAIFSAFSTQMGTAFPIGGFAGFIYILIALLYFFPILYLYRFGSNLKAALATRNSKSLEKAFSNLKSHYKFIGILAIITLSFYVIAFVIGIIAGLGFGAMM